MDHSEHPSAPLTATGWGIALIAALIAAGVTQILGGPAAVIALVTFGVFGVLMGRGGVELTAPSTDLHADAHHGDHH